MFSGSSAPGTNVQPDGLDALITPNINRNYFQNAVHRLHMLFNLYVNTCPAPLPAPGLVITAEIRSQCELYLPIADVTNVFNRLYSATLTYPPVFSSTPFHNSSSWADVFAALPSEFQLSANPARLLESLLADECLLTRFLFASFLPDRFYGSIGRYPGQLQFVREWLATRKPGSLRCLDAACGTGEETYGLAFVVLEQGFSPQDIHIDGWTLDPLEVWVARHRSFPQNRVRDTLLTKRLSPLIAKGDGRCISFHCRDILKTVHGSEDEKFDLILCNGLLGGPIIHEKELLNRAVDNLTQLLAPGGILLAADTFHGGWKQKCPQTDLRALFETHGLKAVESGDGVGGLKPD